MPRATDPRPRDESGSKRARAERRRRGSAPHRRPSSGPVRLKAVKVEPAKTAHKSDQAAFRPSPFRRNVSRNSQIQVGQASPLRGVPELLRPPRTFLSP